MSKNTLIRLALLLSAVLLSIGTAAFGQKTVVLYSAHSSEIIEAMLPRLKAETGLTGEVVKMGSSDIIRRAVAEKDNPQADVIWSIGAEQLEGNPAILEDYKPKEWNKISPVFKVGNKWLPYTGIVMVFVVNTNKLQAADYPRKWTDLSHPKYSRLVSSARADKSGSSYMQLATVINIYKDNGWNVYRSILANFELSGSSSAVPRFVNDGEAAVGITLEDNAYRYVSGGGPVKIIYPEDGTTAAPDGIALVKNGPNAGAGKMFIDWALSKNTQEFLVAKMGRRSVRTDVKASGALPSLTDFKTVRYDFAWSAGNKKKFVKQWTELVMDLGL